MIISLLRIKFYKYLMYYSRCTEKRAFHFLKKKANMMVVVGIVILFIILQVSSSNRGIVTKNNSIQFSDVFSIFSSVPSRTAASFDVCRDTFIPLDFLIEQHSSYNDRRHHHSFRHIWKMYQKNAKNSTTYSNLTLPIQFPSRLIEDLKPSSNKEDTNKKTGFSQILLDNVDGKVWGGNSQDKEDQWLYHHWFYGIVDGIVLESGALDGIKYSNSLFFEKFANWTAIHVEAGESNWNRLIYNRPNAINVHAALCESPAALHYTPSLKKNTEVEGIFEFMSSDFVKRWHPQLIKNPALVDKLPLLTCLPLKYILSGLSLKKVDLWILDVEGAEEKVLSGVDFQRVNISVIVMECDGYDEAKDQRTRELLLGQGYLCQQVLRNCMCRHKDLLQISAMSFEGRAVMSKVSGRSIYLIKDGLLREFPNYGTYSKYLEKGGKPFMMIEDYEMKGFKAGAELESVS